MESTPADGRDECDLGPFGNDGGVFGELVIHRDPGAGEQRGQFGIHLQQSLPEVGDRSTFGQFRAHGWGPHQLAGAGEQMDDHGIARGSVDFVVGSDGMEKNCFGAVRLHKFKDDAKIISS